MIHELDEFHRTLKFTPLILLCPHDYSLPCGMLSELDLNDEGSHISSHLLESFNFLFKIACPDVAGSCYCMGTHKAAFIKCSLRVIPSIVKIIHVNYHFIDTCEFKR